MATRQLEVQIMGQSYLLGCPEGGEARLREAVARVDEAMCRIRDAGKVKARDRIAVLAALNLAFEQIARPAESAARTPSRPPESEAEAAPQDAASQERIASLLQRVDAVLGDDGQLF
ncbi:cell division protein ZapA [Ramlibacter sp. AN1015]|uniref:cell division protein ZapA n=1 Tax=Ramlibacter sp. AN1015 TaxID=3133428 RepID=UPI0030C6131C